MSTEYGFRCRTHTPVLDSPADLREYEARHIFEHRTSIPVVLDFTERLGRVVWDSAYGTALTWLRDHAGCDVVIVDEYGREAAQA